MRRITVEPAAASAAATSADLTRHPRVASSRCILRLPMLCALLCCALLILSSPATPACASSLTSALARDRRRVDPAASDADASSRVQAFVESGEQPEQEEAAKPLRASISNDPTTRITYSADGSEETHCTRTGVCSDCQSSEMEQTFCSRTGTKELVHCHVQAASNNTQSAALPVGDQAVLRTFTEYTSCDADARHNSQSFWAFQFACAALLCVSLWMMLKRRRVVMALHHRRLDRLVNS